MTNRVLWSAVALIGLIFSSGCCCGPCGGCGGGMGLDLGGRFNDDTGCSGSAGKTFCGQGCGERYWGELGTERCDSCDCDGNFTGQCCYGPFHWVDDAWLALWGCTSCNSCNSNCDGGCHGGGCLGDNCPSCNMGGGWSGRRSGGGYGGGGGCSTCGGGQMIDAPMSTPRSQGPVIRESEPTPAPPKPSSTSYRPSRSSVVTMSPASARPKSTTMTKTNSAPAPSVRQVQYENSPPTRTASTPKRTTTAPTRAASETTQLNRPPVSAQDFDLPPGAQIIKIEDQ